MPDSGLEAARDLVRAREDARLERMRDRRRLSKVCLRQGRPLPGQSWSVLRREWLGEQRFDFAAQQQTFDTSVRTVARVDRRIEALEAAIRETAEHQPRGRSFEPLNRGQILRCNISGRRFRAKRTSRGQVLHGSIAPPMPALPASAQKGVALRGDPIEVVM